MSDMLVKLYELDFENEINKNLEVNGIQIKHAMIMDRQEILKFVEENFFLEWKNECEYALFNNPTTCYIAVKDKRLVGFACFEATAKNFFGPTGVLKTERGNGIGKALLFKCLNSMKEMGYAYAIIGWAEEAKVFYEKTVGATTIENSFPGEYGRLIKF